MLRKFKDMLGPASKMRLLWLMYLPFKLRDLIFALYYGFHCTRGWRLHGLPRIHMRDRNSIQIGSSFTAVSRWQKNSIGVIQPVILKTLRKGACINIGDNVGLSGSTISANLSISIGNDVLVGSGALITDCDSHPLNYEARMRDESPRMAAVVIEDGVFIGARSIILKGVTIGRGSVVGAGSVVSCDVPPQVIVAGNPAKILKELK